MTKALEELQFIKGIGICLLQDPVSMRTKEILLYDRFKERLDIVETELKAKEKQDEILRIIKEKPAFLQFILMFDTWEAYYKEFGDWDKVKPHTCYTKDVFNLLKEWLK